tara:strand:- start:3228 stop:5984 length:2757 start_codon:yes stop_codon:yes gene_type:complete
MLIKLSSDNQPDPTKFANNFSEGMMIKPFSKVALIKAQIIRLYTGKKVLINAGTLLNVRFSPYDVIQVVLNPGVDTTYTLKEFSQYVLTLIPDNTAYNRGGQFIDITKDTTTDADLEWRFYFTGDLPNYETFMFGNPEYRRFYIDEVNGKTLPKTGPNDLGVGNNQTQIGGSAAAYACGVAWNTNKYTPPPNQVNKDAHQMLIAGQGETRTSWIIGQPDLKGVRVTFGNATHDGTNYTVGPIVGSDPYTNPGLRFGNMILNIFYSADGFYDINYFNATTNAMEKVVTAARYNPGDIWETHGIGSGQLQDPSRYFYLDGYVKSGNGLAYWIPGKTTVVAGNTAMVLNTIDGQPYNLSLEQFYTTHLTKPLFDCEVRFGELAMGSTYLATGFRFTAGIETDNSGEFEANSSEMAEGGAELISNGIDDIVEGLTGEIKTWVNNAFFLERWTIGAVAGAISDKNAVCRIATNGIPLTTPFYIGFFIRPGDDIGKLAGGINRMTVLGAVNSAVNPTLAQISIGNADVWDLQFWETDGTARDMELKDGGDIGNRINISLNTNYHFSMCYMGTGVGTGQGQLIFRMYDIDNDVLYYKDSLMLGATGLAPIAYLGGIKPEENAGFAKWSCAYYSDFRLYQKCSNVAGHTVSLWDNIQTELQTYWGTGVKTTADWFFGVKGASSNDTTVLPTAAMADAGGVIETQYLVAGLPRPETTITQFFQKSILQAATDPDWYDFLNCYSPSATYLPNANRITTLGATSYAGDECGFVATTEIADELDFVDPTPDLNDNVLQTRTNIVLGNGKDNPFAQLKMDLEDRVLDKTTINIELTNLPHRSYNGTNGSIDKTIYQMPLLGTGFNQLDNLEVLEMIPSTKVWCELNNPGEIPLNRLEIQLSDSSGKKLDITKYSQPTNIVVEIKNKDDIIN